MLGPQLPGPGPSLRRPGAGRMPTPASTPHRSRGRRAGHRARRAGRPARRTEPARVRWKGWRRGPWCRPSSPCRSRCRCCRCRTTSRWSCWPESDEELLLSPDDDDVVAVAAFEPAAVGLVEAAALEGDADVAEHLAQRAAARGAFGEGVVGERLHDFERLAAVLAAVFVGGHRGPLCARDRGPGPSEDSAADGEPRVVGGHGWHSTPETASIPGAARGSPARPGAGCAVGGVVGYNWGL